MHDVRMSIMCMYTGEGLDCEQHVGCNRPRCKSVTAQVLPLTTVAICKKMKTQQATSQRVISIEDWRRNHVRF